MKIKTLFIILLITYKHPAVLAIDIIWPLTKEEVQQALQSMEKEVRVKNSKGTTLYKVPTKTLLSSPLQQGHSISDERVNSAIAHIQTAVFTRYIAYLCKNITQAVKELYATPKPPHIKDDQKIPFTTQTLTIDQEKLKTYPYALSYNDSHVIVVAYLTETEPHETVKDIAVSIAQKIFAN